MRKQTPDPAGCWLALLLIGVGFVGAVILAALGYWAFLSAVTLALP